MNEPKLNLQISFQQLQVISPFQLYFNPELIITRYQVQRKASKYFKSKVISRLHHRFLICFPDMASDHQLLLLWFSWIWFFVQHHFPVSFSELRKITAWLFISSLLQRHVRTIVDRKTKRGQGTSAKKVLIFLKNFFRKSRNFWICKVKHFWFWKSDISMFFSRKFLSFFYFSNSNIYLLFFISEIHF